MRMLVYLYCEVQELILGIQNHVYTYSLKRGEDIETFGETISKKIEELKMKKY